MPGLQKLSYAGKNFEDSQRTLEQCAPGSSGGALLWSAARRPRLG